MSLFKYKFIKLFSSANILCISSTSNSSLSEINDLKQDKTEQNNFVNNKDVNTKYSKLLSPPVPFYVENRKNSKAKRSKTFKDKSFRGTCLSVSLNQSISIVL